MANVKIFDKKQNFEIQYYMDDRLKNNLDVIIIPDLKQKDKDCVIAVDGKEGSGKSTFAFQLAKYVDNDFGLDSIVFTPDAFRDAIYKARKGQAIVYDEAFTGFSSRSSLSAVNRVLVSLMMQMRQKNLFIIIVLPTYFLLDKYVALFRTRALIHVYENKGIRGYFRVYNSKLKLQLYLLGQKTYSYKSKFVRSRFRGRFYGKFALGSEELEMKYREKKAKALEESHTDPMTSAQVRYREQRDIILYLLRKKTELSYQEISNLLLDYQLEISRPQILKICSKFGDAGDNRKKKEPKVIDNKDIEFETEESENNEPELDEDDLEI